MIGFKVKVLSRGSSGKTIHNEHLSYHIFGDGTISVPGSSITIGDLYNIYSALGKPYLFSDWLLSVYSTRGTYIDIGHEKIPNDKLIKMYKDGELNTEMFTLLVLNNLPALKFDVTFDYCNAVWRLMIETAPDVYSRLAELTVGKVKLADYYLWDNLVYLVFRKLGLPKPSYYIPNPRIKKIGTSNKKLKVDVIRCLT